MQADKRGVLCAESRWECRQFISRIIRSGITIEQEMATSALPIVVACTTNANTRTFYIVLVLMVTRPLFLNLKPEIWKESGQCGFRLQGTHINTEFRYLSVKLSWLMGVKTICDVLPTELITWHSDPWTKEREEYLFSDLDTIEILVSNCKTHIMSSYRPWEHYDNAFELFSKLMGVVHSNML